MIRQIRMWEADIVITFHPEGVTHSDNRYVGEIVRDAAPFVAKVPNVIPEVPSLSTIPIFLLMPDFSKRDDYNADIVVDFNQVLEKKLLACDSHVSQFYEFIPWGKGVLDQVPTEWRDKRKYLLEGWGEFFERSDKMNKNLIKWYGEEKSSQIKYAEPFEIAKYGRQPDDQEIHILFPMLG